MADALDKIRPVDVGDEPHRRDDIAHRDVVGRLRLVFALDERGVPGAGLRKSALDLAEGTIDRGALIAQALLEPREKSGRDDLVPQRGIDHRFQRLFARHGGHDRVGHGFRALGVGDA